MTRLVRLTAFSFLIVFILVLLAAHRTNRMFNDVVQQLGTTEQKLHENIETSFFYDYLNYYGATKIKSIVLNDRPAIAKDLMGYTKQYLNSDTYKQKYEKFRQGLKPREPKLETKTKEDIRKKQIAETQKGIANLEETIKKNPAMEKDLKGTMDYLRKTLADYQDPNSKMIEMLYQGHLSDQESKKTRYTNDMAKWETNYPADHRLLIKKRLQKFVDIAKTVDFSAELKDVNGKKIFVNPEYERKSSEWKQIFRAGKAVIDPTVDFAQQWIREIK